MPHTMNNKDMRRAAMALLDWFESQDISERQAIWILTVTLVEMMADMARSNGMNINDGGKLLADCIITSLKERSTRDP